MSHLLKEAIVDAKALRKAALKNAETIVIEKYSTEVRDTLQRLLEQEEELPLDAPLDADMGPDSEVPVDAAPTSEATPTEEVSEDDIPLGATDGFAELDGKNLNDFPGQGEEVEVNINLGALQESIEQLEQALKEDEEIEVIAEDLEEILSEIDVQVDDPAAEADADREQMDDLIGEEEIEEELDPVGEEDDDVNNDGNEDDTDDYLKNRRKKIGQAMGQNEEIDADSLVDAIMEKLTVDMGADLAGWAGRSSDSIKHEMEKELAHRRSTDVEQDLEDLKKAQEELVFENNQIKEQNSQYKQAVVQLKENLQDVNLSNARLLYTNRVLRNTSLNERQKEKIVEAISSAGSVTEARTIYETLQSTVESTPKKSPQSLSEAIGRRSTVLRATRKEAPSSDPLQERMKRLAGIK